MILLVGLGNIGKEYENTRHNAGFMLVDLLLQTSNFTKQSGGKFKGEVFKNKNIILLKPSTFMNLSGESVLAVCNFYKPQRIIVAHDDMDIPLGALRFKKGGSSGGHNGIKNIDLLCTNDYERIRIGIGKSANGKTDTINFVLGKFNQDEINVLNEVLKHALKACNAAFLGASISELASKFSLKVQFSHR